MSNCSLCLCLSVNKPFPIQAKDVKSPLKDASKRHWQVLAEEMKKGTESEVCKSI